MSKFGWDLPPGVTHRMIEEVAGGDPQAEAFAEAMQTRLDELVVEAGLSEDDQNILIDWVWQQIGKAYGDGYKQGMSDEGYAREHQKDDVLSALIVAAAALNKATDGDAYSEYESETRIIDKALKQAGVPGK